MPASHAEAIRCLPGTMVATSTGMSAGTFCPNCHSSHLSGQASSWQQSNCGCNGAGH